MGRSQHGDSIAREPAILFQVWYDGNRKHLIILLFGRLVQDGIIACIVASTSGGSAKSKWLVVFVVRYRRAQIGTGGSFGYEVLVLGIKKRNKGSFCADVVYAKLGQGCQDGTDRREALGPMG